MKNENITTAVKEHYGAVARGEASACGAPVDDVARSIGYSDEELALAGDANLGLGCGNPLALTQIKPGMTVVDLGSGAGFDAFLAWSRVGPTGRVIGVDMTDDMLNLARENAAKRNASNVEFRKGVIEELPVESGTVDYVISNCVINLSADKPAVFREIARVLKPGGHFAVSDIVLLKVLPEELVRDISAYVGCISGASLLTDYLSTALAAGLRDLSIPQIAHGVELMKVLAPDTACNGTTSCCGSTISVSSLKSPSKIVRDAAAAVASIKLHGKK
ncbi:MAG TPA: arsenite methyltransferase [candidate division Zixibacteria bacterium]|nr:arsenite methyltransferase [candidate division Zixibacteria bacterium]